MDPRAFARGHFAVWSAVMFPSLSTAWFRSTRTANRAQPRTEPSGEPGRVRRDVCGPFAQTPLLHHVTTALLHHALFEGTTRETLL